MICPYTENLSPFLDVKGTAKSLQTLDFACGRANLEAFCNVCLL